MTRCWTRTWTWGRSSTSSGSQGRTWCFTTDPLDRDAAATRHLLIIAQQLQTQPGDTSYKVQHNSIKQPSFKHTIPRIGWPYSHHLPKTTYNVHCGNQCWWRCAETPSGPLRRCWRARHCHRGTTPLQWHRSNTMSRENVWRSYWKLCIVIVLKCHQILNYACPSNCYCRVILIRIKCLFFQLKGLKKARGLQHGGCSFLSIFIVITSCQ